MSQHPIAAQKVAEYLLYLDQQTDDKPKSEREGWVPITNLKLQKLLYYCQGFSLGRDDCLLFKDEIHAWKYGPVVPEIYSKYKFTMGEPFVSFLPRVEKPILEDSVENTIKFIYTQPPSNLYIK